jgi:hypothetical protein
MDDGYEPTRIIVDGQPLDEALDELPAQAAKATVDELSKPARNNGRVRTEERDRWCRAIVRYILSQDEEGELDKAGVCARLGLLGVNGKGPDDPAIADSARDDIITEEIKASPYHSETRGRKPKRRANN